MKACDKYNALSNLARKIVMASTVLFWTVHAFPLASVFADATQLTIMQSSNIQGHLFPCPT